MQSTNLKASIYIQAVLFSSFIGLSSCQDGNLFGKLNKTGGSGSAENITSDASIALLNKDYGKALELYNTLLAQNPGNAEALYGAAAANLGTTGLNLGQVIANVTKQTASASSISGLRGLISQSIEAGSSPSPTADTNSYLSGINLTALLEKIDIVNCYLDRILSGSTDGSISDKDTDVLINSAVVHVLRAVSKAIEADVMDITNTNGSIGVTLKGNISTIANTNPDLVKLIGKDVCKAYARLNRAITLLNLGNSQIISQVRDDIDQAGTILFTSGGTNALPANALSILSSIGITISTYKNYPDAFEVPTGC